MNADVMQLLRGQRRPSSPSCASYKFRNFMWTLGMPETAEPWSLTSVREKLINVGAKHMRHGRYRYLSNGRGRGAEKIVRGNSVAD
jgi:hypothetical protein